MRERPILFSAPMVQAILAGHKTQTRRIAKSPKRKDGLKLCFELLQKMGVGHACPYGVVGDRLWVRETWGYRNQFSKIDADASGPIVYRADGGPYEDDGHGRIHGDHWRPSIHMHRRNCRIELEIVSVRIEKLDDISAADAQAEGLRNLSKDGGVTWKFGIPDADGLPGTGAPGWPWKEWCVDPKAAFAKLWDKVHGDGAWDAANPWVWVVEFRRVKPA